MQTEPDKMEDSCDEGSEPFCSKHEDKDKEKFTNKRRKQKLPSDAHKVTFTVTISQAFPAHDDDVPEMDEVVKKKKKVLDVLRAQSYYHMEYQLLPSDNDPVKTDIVLFGVAAKIYPDKQDPRVVKTWQQAGKSWVSWTHSHSVQVTSELLRKLSRHILQLRIWDTKDKCSTRAKFDRPKAFRLPSSKDVADDQNGVRAVVLQQSQAYLDSQPKQVYMERPLPAETPSIGEKTPEPPESQTGSSGGPMGRPVSPAPNTLISIPNKDTSASDGARTYSRLGRLAGMTSPTEGKPKPRTTQSSKSPQKAPGARKIDVKSAEQKRPLAARGQEAMTAPPVVEQPTRKSAGGRSPAEGQAGGVGASGSGYSAVDPSQTKKGKKNDPASQLLAEHLKKHGVAMVPIRMAEFYTGRTTITNRLESPVPSVEDLLISVSLDVPLLSEEQLQMLNPLTLTIQAVGHMPDTPMSYDQLTQVCQPVTCQYRLFRQPSYYQSVVRHHEKHIHFNDINVFLLGAMDDASLTEYLTGPLLEIEVHDRDRKPVDENLAPALFGDELEDEKISNVGVVTSRRTTNNPFTDRGKHWDPYGVAKFDLTGLLRGERVLQLNIPIQPCRMPDLLGGAAGQDKLVGMPGAVDGPADPPLPAGDYLAAGTTLKLRLDLALSLNVTSSATARPEFKCPFGRIVTVFDHNNTDFLAALHTLAARINARAIGLGDHPDHVIQLALATFKLSREQQCSQTLDILTGFHVMDGIRHIVILEGLLGGALQQFWQQLSEQNAKNVRVYFNTDLSFCERIYRMLDVDLPKIKLHEPLDNIVQRSLLYVRDMVPKPCFQAVTKLHQLLSLVKLKDVVRNDLFPTAEEILSLSKELGVPIVGEDFEEATPTGVASDSVSRRQMSRYSLAADVAPQRRRWSPVDHYNQDFLHYLQHRDEFPIRKDHIRHNIDEVKCESAKNQEVRESRRLETVSAPVWMAHNYSAQSLNSTELAKDKLRQMLAERSPGQLYTYCHSYHHSMTVVPVDVVKQEKQAKANARRKWKSVDGWRFPGMRRAIDNNQHPNRPDQTRIDELAQEWEENILHAGVLKPTLPARECYPWTLRHQDLDIWTKPPELFDPDLPASIHLAGYLRQKEEFQAAAEQYKAWKRQICVNNLHIKCHRCLPATEMTAKGKNASNQRSRLDGLLKDLPLKFGLRCRGMHQCPPLSVVANPSVDYEGRRTGRVVKETLPSEFNHGYGPGPFKEHKWTMNRNAIPLRSYEHEKFADLKGQDFNIYHKDRNLLHQHRSPRTVSQHVDVTTWNLPRAESYKHQDDLEYLSRGAIRYINKHLQDVAA